MPSAKPALTCCSSCMGLDLLVGPLESVESLEFLQPLWLAAQVSA